MTIKNFIKKRPYLIWYVNDLENISQESIVENVLNYGTFEDVKKMNAILGLKNVSHIFFKQLKARRNNYRPEIKNYFKLYFKKYLSEKEVNFMPAKKKTKKAKAKSKKCCCTCCK